MLILGLSFNIILVRTPFLKEFLIWKVLKSDFLVKQKKSYDEKAWFLIAV